MGNVFLDQIPAGPAREARLAGFVEKLKAYPLFRAYPKAELPAAWAYAHPTRTGDLVVVLPRGYTFSGQATQPVMDIAQAGGGPLGMHGYPVEDDPEMYGALLMWRYPQPFGGKGPGRSELEPVSSHGGEVVGHSARRKVRRASRWGCRGSKRTDAGNGCRHARLGSRSSKTAGPPSSHVQKPLDLKSGCRWRRSRRLRRPVGVDVLRKALRHGHENPRGTSRWSSYLLSAPTSV